MLRTISTVKTLPGSYSEDERTYNRRYTIMSVRSAVCAHRSEINGAEVQQDELKSKPIFVFMVLCAFRSFAHSRTTTQTRVVSGTECPVQAVSSLHETVAAHQRTLFVPIHCILKSHSWSISQRVNRLSACGHRAKTD
nr:hypothetical protein CFP56_03270 [Quercus suber]